MGNCLCRTLCGSVPRLRRVSLRLRAVDGWNDYLYPSTLLSPRNMTVAVTQGLLFTDTDAPWNAMMAAAVIYVLPPIGLLFALRRYIAASLTMVRAGA